MINYINIWNKYTYTNNKQSRMNFTFPFHYFQRNKAVTSTSQLTIVPIFFLFFFSSLLDRSYHKLPINMVLSYTRVYASYSFSICKLYARTHAYWQSVHRCPICAREARTRTTLAIASGTCIRATISHARESKMSSQRRRAMGLWIIKSAAANSEFSERALSLANAAWPTACKRSRKYVF